LCLSVGGDDCKANITHHKYNTANSCIKQNREIDFLWFFSEKIAMMTISREIFF
jgi:hypothetical protein